MADQDEDVNIDGSIPMYKGGLYTVEDRLNTFRVPHCSWPFDSGPCTPQKIAEAGFYYCGTAHDPDWVRCVICHQNVDGWEENDDPMEEHKRCSPKCAFVKLKDPYNITFGDLLDLKKAAVDFFVNIEISKLESDMVEMVTSAREEVIRIIEQIKQKD